MCEGYRSSVDYLFRDQTATLAEKMRGAERCGTSQSDTSNQCTMSLSTRGSTLSSCAASAEDQALCFFFNKFGTPESAGSPPNLYSYLPEMYNTKTEDNLLQDVVMAIGLAGISLRNNSTRTLVNANTLYDKALVQMNTALRDPKVAATDRTLTSVLLCGLYEAMTHSERRSTTNWLRHLQGANALLGLRGKAQLSTEFGRRLFHDLRSQILSLSSLTRTPLPDAIIELTKENHEYSNSASDRLLLIVEPFYRIRSERPFRPLKPDDESVDCDIIARTCAVVDQLKAWRLSLPLLLSPVSVPATNKRTDVFGDYYDTYQDVDSALLLNIYRSHTILALELIINRLVHLQQIQRASDEQIFQVMILRAEVLSHVEAVCASVPFLLGFGRMEVARCLVWPLFLGAQLELPTMVLSSNMREWIIERLKFIGHEMGVRQAVFAAAVLRGDQEVTELVEEDFHGG